MKKSERRPSDPVAVPVSESPARPRRADRRPYRKPEIVDHGRLVELALGGSPGIGDSGPGMLIENPPQT